MEALQPATLRETERQIRRKWQRYIHPVVHHRHADGLLAALVVASSSLDEILFVKGYVGRDHDERLRAARHSFTDYVGVRAARRLRNQIVHDISFSVCWPAGAAALKVFARALWEHGIDTGLDVMWYAVDEYDGCLVSAWRAA